MTSDRVIDPPTDEMKAAWADGVAANTSRPPAAVTATVTAHRAIFFMDKVDPRKSQGVPPEPARIGSRSRARRRGAAVAALVQSRPGVGVESVTAGKMSGDLGR